jgi:hypothetical protein
MVEFDPNNDIVENTLDIRKWKSKEKKRRKYQEVIFVQDALAKEGTDPEK